MNRECKLSKRAKTMPLDGMPPDETLFIEVSRRLKRFYEENIGDLCDRLAFEYGSVEDAIAAVRSGDVRFTRVKLDGVSVWTALRDGREIRPVAEAELALRLERSGLFEKVLDANGSVVTQPGSNGLPQIIWRRTDKNAERTQNH